MTTNQRICKLVDPSKPHHGSQETAKIRREVARETESEGDIQNERESERVWLVYFP